MGEKVGTRSRLAYATILALIFALLVPVTAIAAEKQGTVDVAAARVAAENQLIARGIDPSTAVFQIGVRNYAGPDCPGSGWNCTSAATVVQIATGAALSSVNKAECTAAECVLPPQFSDGGMNEARCVQRTSTNPTIAPPQTCTIIQTNTTGTNKAFVSQSIKQSQPDGSQDARQLVKVTQANGAGTNDSAINQTIEQRETSEVGTGVTQTQEAHQRADVCQGGSVGFGGFCSGASNGKNVSDVSQSNAQRLNAHFDGSSSGTTNQYQNKMGGAGPTSLAVVSQSSIGSTNDSGLLQSNRQIATVHDGDKDNTENDEELSHPGPFAGFVNQWQGVGTTDCPDAGVCGFVTQDSTGVQHARERQNELQKVQGPPGPNTIQTQYGPVFCCATQTGSPINTHNDNDVSQVKVQLHTSSFTYGKIQGHCDSSPSNCNVKQTLRQNQTTQSNSCTNTAMACNPTIVCISGTTDGLAVQAAGCTPGNGTAEEIQPPCPSALCPGGDAPNKITMIAPLRFEGRSANL